MSAISSWSSSVDFLVSGSLGGCSFFGALVFSYSLVGFSVFCSLVGFSFFVCFDSEGGNGIEFVQLDRRHLASDKGRTSPQV